MKRVVASGMVLLTLTGCFRLSVRSGAPREGLPSEQTGVSLVYGLTASDVAAGECRNGLSRVDVYWPWWAPFVYVFSFGIVAPLRTEYVCAEAGSPDARDPQLPASTQSL
ncbi:hypothetical protein DRW03_29560 [Corallococcus sp. H22C18031201]|uniref:hypothetical protein n=1 Tax=Citreicoccus inhibens TaxID=2849499 RepID=UPI000E74EA09|nr:hypothetical protein [Citreicoccus inhibens]MBU8897399.1 hypothetical protein [Citreicoccus inhibens]RJS16820.1 hypothetical protein DRW03_29560 [Corallococcus sp. H22C18031201]